MKSKLDALKFIEPKENLKENDKCPNCNKGILRSSYAMKTMYQKRYAYFLFCTRCSFRYLKKFGVTGAGRIKDIDFTEKELKETQKNLIGR